MEELENILKNYLNKGSDRIDVTAVLSLIKIIKEEQKKQLTLTDVVKPSLCELYDFGRQDKTCEKKCDSCKWMEEQ
jgi:hypothetical protein